MKFEVNVPIRKNIFKRKDNKMENDVVNANEVVKESKIAISDYISDHPGTILLGAAAIFYVGYQTGKSHQLNELIRASMQ